jgi:hypothetical protein
MTFSYFKYPNSIKLLLVIYIVGFAIGTTNHTIGLIEGGFLPYTDVPLWKNIYWTALTFLDFLALFLIFKSLKPALLISNLIIISDVLINTKGLQFFNDFNIFFQILFGLYIVTTTPIIILKYKKTVK